MEFVLDLSGISCDRIFVVGNVSGNYGRLINLLYQQRFGHNDILISTGDFIDIDNAFNSTNQEQLETIIFMKNLVNTYSVKGKNEFDFLRRLEENTTPEWLLEHPKSEQILNFIEELPLIIKVSDYIYIVNAGVQPNLPLDQQNPEVFYSIGDYDKESRFYAFENPEEKSWYDFENCLDGKQIRFCFSRGDLDTVKVPAGYFLGRSSIEPMKALVFKKDQEHPILLES